ncbi:hypothetical protein KBB96_06520 [Luteolibacter ambystomatis]|uniref:DUF2846 domain-containing protein n=1 Tax=Luteolibacter ambystomatis TaxID=2824561 RepID=A0A975J1Y2_9BACT|nr:hypothetical protein [Luteolibacter ambystomatis]QUE52543.1 hypothetical protein KBB96_06520 [Luteolibacter ambystomatis]
MRFLLLPVLLAGVLSVGCAPQRELHSMADVARITGKLPSDRATVFVHLPETVGPFSGSLTVDGREVARLSPGSFTKLTLPGGIHVFDMKWSMIATRMSDDQAISLQNGHVHTIAIENGPRNHRNLVKSIMNETFVGYTHFRDMNAMDGIQSSRYEKYVEAR